MAVLQQGCVTGGIGGAGRQQQLYGMREKAAAWRSTIELAGLVPGYKQRS